MTPADAALELVRLSTAIAEALESRDLDQAERLLDEREILLVTPAAPATGPGPAHSAVLRAAGGAVRDADRRSHSALSAAVSDLRRELAGIATGAAAMRAYDTPESYAPGFVDRRD